MAVCVSHDLVSIQNLRNGKSRAGPKGEVRFLGKFPLILSCLSSKHRRELYSPCYLARHDFFILTEMVVKCLAHSLQNEISSRAGVWIEPTIQTPLSSHSSEAEDFLLDNVAM